MKLRKVSNFIAKLSRVWDLGLSVKSLRFKGLGFRSFAKHKA